MTYMAPSRFQSAVYDAVRDDSRHLLVEARAGSGKTTTLVECFDHISSHKVVGASAFARSDKETLEARAPAHVKVQTFNSLGAAACRMAGVGTGPVVKHKVHNAARVMMKRFKIREDDKVHYDIVRGVELAKATLTQPGDVPRMMELIETFSRSDLAVELLGRIADATLTMTVKDRKEIDFTDQIYMPWYYGLRIPAVDVMFVDEIQDMSPAQLFLIGGATRERLVGFGDRAQSIYQWRGAGASVMDDVARHLKATQLPLSITYRCARAIVEHVRATFPPLQDFEAREDAPEGEVLDMPLGQAVSSLRPGDFFLSRTNAPLATVALTLLRRGTPVVIYGKGVESRSRDFLENGIAAGATSSTAMLAYLETAAALEQSRGLSPTMMVEVFDAIDTAKVFLAASSSPREALTKMTQLTSSGLPSGCVVCSTVHKIKGREADRVFLLAPTFHADTDEEKNILYVAMTRARNTLIMVSDD